jgi:hypothetical protein
MSAMDIPPHASTPPTQYVARELRPPVPPPPKLHPWEGIVPPERRGAGAMADPLLRPDPVQYMTQSLWLLPGNPTVPGSGLTRASFPPPRTHSGGSFEPEDLDDDNYEWVPRGEDRRGRMRMRKK